MTLLVHTCYAIRCFRGHGTGRFASLLLEGTLAVEHALVGYQNFLGFKHPLFTLQNVYSVLSFETHSPAGCLKTSKGKTAKMEAINVFDFARVESVHILVVSLVCNATNLSPNFILVLKPSYLQHVFSLHFGSCFKHGRDKFCIAVYRFHPSFSLHRPSHQWKRTGVASSSVLRVEKTGLSSRQAGRMGGPWVRKMHPERLPLSPLGVHRCRSPSADVSSVPKRSAPSTVSSVRETTAPSYSVKDVYGTKYKMFLARERREWTRQIDQLRYMQVNTVRINVCCATCTSRRHACIRVCVLCMPWSNPTIDPVDAPSASKGDDSTRLVIFPL